MRFLKSPSARAPRRPTGQRRRLCGSTPSSARASLVTASSACRACFSR